MVNGSRQMLRPQHRLHGRGPCSTQELVMRADLSARVKVVEIGMHSLLEFQVGSGGTESHLFAALNVRFCDLMWVDIRVLRSMWQVMFDITVSGLRCPIRDKLKIDLGYWISDLGCVWSDEMVLEQDGARIMEFDQNMLPSCATSSCGY